MRLAFADADSSSSDYCVGVGPVVRSLNASELSTLPLPATSDFAYYLRGGHLLRVLSPGENSARWCRAVTVWNDEPDYSYTSAWGALPHLCEFDDTIFFSVSVRPIPFGSRYLCVTLSPLSSAALASPLQAFQALAQVCLSLWSRLVRELVRAALPVRCSAVDRVRGAVRLFSSVSVAC